MLAEADASVQDLSGWTMIIIGGSALPPALCRSARAKGIDMFAGTACPRPARSSHSCIRRPNREAQALCTEPPRMARRLVSAGDASLSCGTQTWTKD